VTADEDRAIDDRAIGWHVRLRAADVSTWEAFEVWLGKDSRHLAAFEGVAALDPDIDDALGSPQPRLSLVANGTMPAHRASRRWWIGGASAAVAAALIAIIAGPGIFAGSRYQIATTAGQHLNIDLGDGSQIAMNGATRITLDRNDKRFAALDSGEATFSIRHDPTHPFAVDVGGVKVRDTGTVFNVVRKPEGVTVEVRAGSVVYDADKEAVPVKAGQALNAATGSTKIIVTPKRPESIATWREGRLDYDMEPFTTIASDVSRNLGTPVIVDPALAQRRFSGTITLERNHPRFFARLAALLGVKVKRDGAAWRMSVR
jgi:transmembrane sensor